MRKRIIPGKQKIDPLSYYNWLDLKDIADVEITSEDPGYPIENALIPENTSGWRAAEPGEQTVRLLFSEPQTIKNIWVYFEEPHIERTQQFVLRYSADNGQTFREIIRQQWNFSPHGSKEQSENIQTDISGVTMIELTINPDISGGDVKASLARFLVG